MDKLKIYLDKDINAELIKSKKIAIIGHFASGKDFYDGQTVSTRLLENVLKNSGCFKKICKVDTFNYKRNAIKVLFSWLSCMFSCSYIILMVSGNGIKLFSPMLYYGNKIFKKKIFHRVIGGELDGFLVRNEQCIKYLNSFEVNWVQSNKLVERLNRMGINNAEYLENFREITPIVLSDEPTRFEKPYKLCTFCRVSEAKGISLAIESVAKVNEMLGKDTAVLHVYGPVEDAYSEVFHSLLDKHSDCVAYMGSVPSEKAVDTLKNYYMHLFPTTWSGEGFPGTLIDCYNAALPTIASTWAYNSELITEGETGYLYDWDKPEQLTERIIEAIENERNVWQMKKMCLEEAKKYQSEVVTAKIIARIIG